MGVARTPFLDKSRSSIDGRRTRPRWGRTNRGIDAWVAHREKVVPRLRGISRRIEAPGEGICGNK
jgi:hypothetical protein